VISCSSLRAAVGIACTILCTTHALGQQATKPADKSGPASKAPAKNTKDVAPGVASQPVAQDNARRAEPSVGPYIKLSQPKDLILLARVRVIKGNKETQIHDAINNQTAVVTTTEPFEAMKSIAMIWPILPPSGSSTTTMDGITGKLMLDDKIASAAYKPLKGYQGDVTYARFDALTNGEDMTPRKVELEVSIPVNVSRTDFDEKAAIAVGWPTAWPRIAKTWLQPQLCIETNFDEHNKVVPYDEKPITDALAAAAKQGGITDFKQVSPVMAAKIITSYVWGGVQIVSARVGKDATSGELPATRLAKDASFTANDLGGIIVQPPKSTIDTGRGTEYDASALLTAMLKKAGLPAHPVIGYDRGGSGGSRNGLTNRNSGSNRSMRCWVEFALFDQANNTINWVPIDIGKLNKTSSRPMPTDKPWRYFGTHDELNNIAPIAFHFFPPTDVVSYGAPGFWGWFVTPQAPVSAGQAISFSVSAASVRGGQDNPDQMNNGEDPNKPSTPDQKKPDSKKDREEKKKKKGLY
jgi:hypothetical protein